MTTINEDTRQYFLGEGGTMFFVLWIACTNVTISDDPGDYDVDSTHSHQLEFSDPQWLVPSELLPAGVEPMESNNNVDIHHFQGRWFVGWRSAPTHFAGEETRMWIISSEDGEDWELELEIALGTDVREPRFFSIGDELQFSYFEAGSNPMAFEPKRLWRIWKTEEGWSDAEPFMSEKDVMWDIKLRGGIAYMTTYDGAHYQDGEVFVRFWQSQDGRSWSKVDGTDYVYRGGVSEVAFEFDANGNLWAIGRNEDGDATGAGSQLCYASKEALSAWECLGESDPERTDSPEMFRHGEDIYLLARKDIGGPYGPEGDLLAYSFRPKGFALYRINQSARQIEWVQDLPGVGDTAFPSIRRLDAHRFRFANYTAPLDDPDVSWIEAQGSPRGTQIYLMDLEFVGD